MNQLKFGCSHTDNNSVNISHQDFKTLYLSFALHWITLHYRITLNYDWSSWCGWVSGLFKFCFTAASPEHNDPLPHKHYQQAIDILHWREGICYIIVCQVTSLRMWTFNVMTWSELHRTHVLPGKNLLVTKFVIFILCISDVNHSCDWIFLRKGRQDRSRSV